MSVPTPNPPKTQLVTLPQELFDNVTGNLRAEELSNLRLVSHETQRMVFDTYKRECFQTKSILPCSEDSLIKAIDAAKHPVYGPLIQKVRVYVNGPGEHPRERFIELEDSDDEFEDFLSDSEDLDDDDSKYIDFECDESDFKLEEKYYLPSLLGDFFAALDNKTKDRRTIALEFCGISEDSRIDVGRHEFNDLLKSCKCCSLLMADIFNALLDTKLAVRELTLNQNDGTATDCFPGEGMYNEIPHANVWPHLEHLNLTLWRDTHQIPIHNLARNLSVAQNLKSLSIKYIYKPDRLYFNCEHVMSPFHEDGIIADLASHDVQCESLEEMFFNGMTIGVRDLFDFVALQPKLKKITIFEENHFYGWEEFVEKEGELRDYLEEVMGVEIVCLGGSEEEDDEGEVELEVDQDEQEEEG